MDSSSQENHIKIYLVQRSILVVCNSRILCIAIFLYQASICFDQFKNQGGASKTEFVNQEKYPRPLVCLSSKGFGHKPFNDTGNLTFQDYLWGSWKIGNLSEEDTFNFFAANISDLISSIRIDRHLGPIGNKYKRHYFTIDEKSNFTDMGIQISRKDYYVYLKTFCLNMR